VHLRVIIICTTGTTSVESGRTLVDMGETGGTDTGSTAEEEVLLTLSMEEGRASGVD
jgi:hypothetical protein